MKGAIRDLILLPSSDLQYLPLYQDNSDFTIVGSLTRRSCTDSLQKLANPKITVCMAIHNREHH